MSTLEHHLSRPEILIEAHIAARAVGLAASIEDDRGGRRPAISASFVGLKRKILIPKHGLALFLN